MNITVTQAQSEAEERAIRHLFLDFFYDLSAYDPNIAINEAGLPMWLPSGPPGPQTLDEAVRDNWWIRDRCARYLIRTDDRVAGFATVCTGEAHMPPEVQWELLDFYIAPPFRRRGVGQQAARLLFDSQPGTWQLFVLPGNEPARAFWRSVITPYTGGDHEERREATEFRLRSRAAAP